MEALFIGQTYIDVTFLTDHIPTGDDKTVANNYAVSFGGNAVTAAFCCAKLGVVPDLLTSLADDWLGRMFLDMAAKYQIPVHGRKVKESSLSFVIPNNGKRAIIRCRDDDYLHPFPTLRLDGIRALHLDGHQSDAALAACDATDLNPLRFQQFKKAFIIKIKLFGETFTAHSDINKVQKLMRV